MEHNDQNAACENQGYCIGVGNAMGTVKTPEEPTEADVEHTYYDVGNCIPAHMTGTYIHEIGRTGEDVNDPCKRHEPKQKHKFRLVL